jgi:hypothetical protein
LAPAMTTPPESNTYCAAPWSSSSAVMPPHRARPPSSRASVGTEGTVCHASCRSSPLQICPCVAVRDAPSRLRWLCRSAPTVAHPTCCRAPTHHRLLRLWMAPTPAGDDHNTTSSPSPAPPRSEATHSCLADDGCSRAPFAVSQKSSFAMQWAGLVWSVLLNPSWGLLSWECVRVSPGLAAAPSLSYTLSHMWKCCR